MEKRRVRTSSPMGSVFESDNDVANTSRRSSLCHQNASQRNWERVRQAFLNDELPVPILMVENAFMLNETSSPLAPGRDIDSGVLPMETMQREVQMQNASGPSRAIPSPLEAERPNVTTETPASRKWGSPEETDELNRDIQECLRIEGVESPEVFFNEPVDNFQSVAHYYIHLTKRLESVDIELYESLQSHLGSEHPLVQDMARILEQEPQRTYLSREPTAIQSERLEEGSRVGVPGMQAFSEECRALSWVIRTGPRIANRISESTAEERVVSPTVVNSSADHGGQKSENGHIVCPGLPVSMDTYEAPPPRTTTPYVRPTKRTMWSRVRSCFCFSA